MIPILLIVLLALVAVVVIVALYGVGVYNRLVQLRQMVKNAWSQIDVQLKRRHDLIPNLVNTVKGYAAHEKGTLDNVTAARTAVQQATASGTVEQKAAA